STAAISGSTSDTGLVKKSAGSALIGESSACRAAASVGTVIGELPVRAAYRRGARTDSFVFCLVAHVRASPVTAATSSTSLETPDRHHRHLTALVDRRARPEPHHPADLHRS
ncbi:MAG: hypothetical protein WCC38_12555, partial [Pseudonocardiaceae bacterium]